MASRRAAGRSWSCRRARLHNNNIVVYQREATTRETNPGVAQTTIGVVIPHIRLNVVELSTNEQVGRFRLFYSPRSNCIESVSKVGMFEVSDFGPTCCMINEADLKTYMSFILVVKFLKYRLVWSFFYRQIMLYNINYIYSDILVVF